MKHAKKMIMVPEVEYSALLSMIKGGGGGGGNKGNIGGDYLDLEMLRTDAKIHQNLTDPRQSEEARGRKHDFLYKQRRKLKNIIENKAQKVVIEHKPSTDVAAYLGIAKPINTINASAVPLITADAPRAATPEPQKRYETQQQPTASHKKHIHIHNKGDAHQSNYIDPKFYEQLLEHVQKNASKLGVAMDSGQILTYKDDPIEDSSFANQLKFLTEQTDEPSRGHTFFMARLTKDEYFKKLREISQQGGDYIEGDQEGLGHMQRLPRKDIKPKGRHVVIRVAKNIKARQKTRGLFRGEYGGDGGGGETGIKADKHPRKQTKQQNIFRPKLWERI